MLTAQKKIFARGIVAGLNQTEAAIAAGYSESTARIQASQLMKQPEIIKEIERLKQPETIADPFIGDAMEFMQHLMNDQRRDDPDIALRTAIALAKYQYNDALAMGERFNRKTPQQRRLAVMQHDQNHNVITVQDWSLKE